MNKTSEQVVQWASDKGLVDNSTWEAQYVKLTEEKDELMVALMAKDLDSIEDELGDCLVVLTVVAAQHGLTIEQCYKRAYNKISKRKGKTINGIFVKESDL